MVAVPIYKNENQLNEICKHFKSLENNLKSLGISFKLDDDDNRRPGWKFAEYESKGVPIRLAMGPRDLENGKVELARRDTRTKEILDFNGIETYIKSLLTQIQESLYSRLLNIEKQILILLILMRILKKQIKKGGFFMAHWDGTKETELLIKEQTQATIRCIPFNAPEEMGKCMVTGKESKGRVVFAKAY